jgi:hypothetical protein
MAQIDSLDNLRAEFEQAAGTISQLQQLASSAETLKSKLEAMLGDWQSKANSLQTKVDAYRDGMSEIKELKSGFNQQIDEAKVFVSNSSKVLVGLKNEVTSIIGDVAAKMANAEQFPTRFAALEQSLISRTDHALVEIDSKTKQLRQDLSDSVGQSMELLSSELKTKAASTLGDVEAMAAKVDNTAVQFAAQFATLEEGAVSRTNQAIASLPGEFVKLKQELERNVNKALQVFLDRQTTLVSNLNQRNDALQSLVETQETQRTLRSNQLDAALTRIEKLEEVIAKRSGIFGLFK